MSNQPGVSSDITANATPYFQTLDRVLSVTQNTFNQVGTSIGGISGPIGMAMSRLTAIGAALGGGVIFRKAITETVELTRESMSLGRALGGTAQQGATWIAALDDVNASTSDLQSASKGLLKNVRDNEEALNKMGLVTRDSSGELRGMEEIMLDAIATVNGYTEGTDRNLAAQAVFGKGVSGNSELLLINSETIEQNRQLQEELGLVVGEQAVANYKKYDAAMDAADIAMKSMWSTVGQLLMPILTQLAQWFRDIAPAAIVILKGALGGVATVLHGIIFVINVVWSAFATAFKSMTAIGRGFADTMGALLRGDFAGAKAAAAGVFSDLKALDADWRAGMVRSAEQTRDNIAAIWGVGGEGQAKPAAEAAAGKAFVDTKKEESKGPSASASYSLAQQRMKAIQEQLDAAGRYLKELTELEDSAADHKRDLGLQEVDQRREQLSRMAEMGQITRAQEMEGYRALEVERYAIERAALERRATDLGVEQIDRQRALQNLELMEREHNERLRLLDQDAQLARAQTWRDLFGGMQNGFQSVLSATLRGTQTLGGTLRGLATTVLDVFSDMVAKIAAKWLTMKIASLLFNKSAITGESAKAGAGGTASMAAAPFPLNLGAPAFGAAMAAVAASYLAIPAAARGYDIPSGVNPLTQLHQREMVLPENLADVVRGMAERGAGGASIELRTMRAGPGELLVRERDLVATLSKLGLLNYRPG